MYTEHGYPWFDLYDETQGDVFAPAGLSHVKSVKTIDAEKGFLPQQDDTEIIVPDVQVMKIEQSPMVVENGNW